MANENIGIDLQIFAGEALATLNKINNQVEKLGDTAVKETQKINKGFDLFKTTLGTIVAVNFAQEIKDQLAEAFNAFKKFEVGLVSVQKTTDLSDKELIEFTEGIQNLTRVLPVASEELLGIAEAAGQLGVKGTKNLLIYTETIAKLGKASDVSGAEAATALTRILGVTNESVGSVDKLASVIVALGNNFAATESEIIRVTNEVARVTSQFGVSSAEAAALSATLRSFGVRAEEAGSAVGKTFRAIQLAIESGGKSAQELSKLTGIATDDLKKQFGKDAVDVFQKFLVGINEAKLGGSTFTAELKKLGLEGEIIAKVIPTLASRTDELTRALATSNFEVKNATALNREFAKFAETTESKTQLFGNAVERLQIVVGKGLAEAFKLVIGPATDFVNLLSGGSDAAFIQNAKSADELNKRLVTYKQLLEDVKASPGYGAQINESVESLTKKINDLNVAIANTQVSGNVEELAKLESQLKSLDEQASIPINFNLQGPDDGLGVLMPSPDEAAARREQLVAQIENLRTQISLQNNTLVEENKKKYDEDAANAVDAEKTKFSAIAELKAAIAEQELEEKTAAAELKQFEADSDIQFLVDNLGRENTERELARIKNIEDTKKRNEELKKLNDKAREQEKAGIFEIRKFEDLTNREKIAAQKETLGAIAGLSQSNNSALFAIGKAASLSLAGINIAEGVTKALSAFPPPFNFAAAAAVGAAGAVQIAKIASSQPPKFADGGIIEGASSTGDRLTANVNAGEMILNKRQQATLFNDIASGNIGGGSSGIVINIQGDFLSSDQSVDKIIDTINDAVEFRNKQLRA